MTRTTHGRGHLRTLVAALALAVAPGGPSAGAAAATDVANDAAAYRIGPEDVLEISVWNQEDLHRVVPVRPDGRISLPLVGDIEAAGRSPSELRDVVAARLAEFVTAPVVSVIVAEIHSFKVAVMGEVRKPGRYELGSRATVLDVLALAEGFTEYADRGNIVVLRHDGATQRRIRFDYGGFTSPNSSAAPLFVEPNDIIIVR